MPEHLRRLDRVWIQNPIYFITTCTLNRRQALAVEPMHAVLRGVWANTQKLYGWYVGRYVVMPDHVHFFCVCPAEQTSLSLFVGKWKEWTAKYAHRRLKMPPRLWQPEFFDHVLRSSESYKEKWHYVRQNPIRAGLVGQAEDWAFQGEIHDLRFELKPGSVTPDWVLPM